ncbi:MAG: hypothetical protein DWB45_10665, partial [Xanthomonadales bacterium]|nr:hypothetical protein [Xanthomonadales bacterium]
SRVPASDVLTIRYQRGTGWPVGMGACATPAAAQVRFTIDGSGNAAAASATVAYALSPRWFVQGYSCSSSSCTPTMPTGPGQIPAMGLADGSRVPASDVLTIRYQRGTGWPVGMGACATPAAALRDTGGGAIDQWHRDHAQSADGR